MKLSKRVLVTFVVLLAATGTILVTFIIFFRTPSVQFVNEQLVPDGRLYIPPLLPFRIQNGEKVFSLEVQKGETEFIAGKRTQTLGYNGSYLGPTIRAHTGDKVRIEAVNHLDIMTTIHWHGLHVPAGMDGGPHQPINPGETWQPNWTIANEASTLWYHPHNLGSTGEQLYRGLAGLFIIDDKNSDGLNLPKEYGVDDFPLIVQDRKFDSEGQFVYQRYGQNQSLPAAAGMLGDTILVNGTRAPYLDVPGKSVRFRLVNGSNGRRYNFGFSDNRAFSLIATDGGLLDTPVETNRVMLGVGERAEIVVYFSNTTGPVTLLGYPVEDKGNLGQAFARPFFGDNDANQKFTILELRPRSVSYSPAPLPTRLNSIMQLNPSQAVKTRRFSLDMRTINNKSMDHSRVDEVVKKGDIEIWEIRNESPYYHPFHIHGFQFQVLDRQLNGQRTVPPPYEKGWKDTVMVNSAETVRVIIQFNDYSDPTLPYMFHCHILEHEDMGMMGQFVVVDNLSDVVKIKSPLTGDSEKQHQHS